MGFMDGVTSDGTVDMKHTEYYNLMKEAAKAELLSNAVKAEVPGFYIQAMITGEKPEFLNELKAEEEDMGFHAEYEQITGAVVSVFEAWTEENGVESAAASLHRLIDTLELNRIDEFIGYQVKDYFHLLICHVLAHVISFLCLPMYSLSISLNCLYYITYVGICQYILRHIFIFYKNPSMCGYFPLHIEGNFYLLLSITKIISLTFAWFASLLTHLTTLSFPSAVVMVTPI